VHVTLNKERECREGGKKKQRRKKESWNKRVEHLRS